MIISKKLKNALKAALSAQAMTHLFVIFVKKDMVNFMEGITIGQSLKDVSH